MINRKLILEQEKDCDLPRSLPTHLPTLVPSLSHLATLLLFQGSPKLLLHQSPNSSGFSWVLAWSWDAYFQPQRHRPGANASPGLDHQSPHSLGGEATKTSPWGGHQQEVQVGRTWNFHRGKLHEYSDSTLETFPGELWLNGNGKTHIYLQLENASSTHLSRLAWALKSKNIIYPSNF